VYEECGIKWFATPMMQYSSLKIAELGEL